MTLSRIAALTILIFCGTMTTLLVRSVYWPEESGLSAVASQVPVELFIKRSEGAELDIWEANRVTGNLYLSPSGLTTRKDGVRGGKIRLEATVRLKQPVLESQLLGVRGTCFFSLSGAVDDLDLRFNLPSQPEINLAIQQPAGDKWPSIQLVRGEVTLFESKGGQSLDDANSYLVNLITSAAGLSPEALFSQDEPVPPVVRAGRISAGGEPFDGFYIAPGGEGGETFRLYMANTGEILRIETPFSKSSELGLRFLSQALRPAGTVVPELNLDSRPLPKKLP